MIVIIVPNLDSNEISQLVRELKSQGYIVGNDFDFEFSAGRYDYDTRENIPRQTKFTFYNEAMASYFSLKYL